MKEDSFDSALPNPGQIIKFICRSFSHVDDQNHTDIKKPLDRFAAGSPKDTRAAFRILFRQMKNTFKIVGPENGRVLITQFELAWQRYITIVRELKCGPLPKSDVVRVLDHYLFNLLFSDLLEFALKPIGVPVSEILGSPESATKIVWSIYQGERSRYRLANDLATNTDFKSEDIAYVSEDAWKQRLNRIDKGDAHFVSKILEITKFDQDFGFALLIVNAYRRYCEFPFIKERSQNHAENDKNTVNNENWFSELQAALIRENQTYVNSLWFPSKYSQFFKQAKKLTDPKRPKLDGDLTKAKRVLGELKMLSGSLPQEFCDMPLRGHFHLQNRDLKLACQAFENYCEYAQLRDGPCLKYGLSSLLPLAVFLGQNRLVTKWEKWGSFFGLEINLDKDKARILLLKKFPNKYAETEEILNVELVDFGFIDQSEWKNRKPDLQNPNRMVKGIGTNARPQVAIFAGFGQFEKVERLIAKGANINVVDSHGATPLIYAVQGGCHKCVDIILSHTSPEFLNKVTSKIQQHALSAAIDNADVVTIEKILKAGIDVDLRGGLSRTSLYSVICELQPCPDGPILHSKQDILKYVKMQPDSSICSPFLHDQSHVALRQLRQNEVVLKTIRRFQQQRLSMCAPDIVQLLLDHGANTRAVHDRGYTPRMAAAELGFYKIYNRMVMHASNQTITLMSPGFSQ